MSAPAAATPAVSASRLLTRTGQQTQRDFRVLVDVLARPGTVRRLDVPAGAPPAAVVAAGLLDIEVALAVIGGDDPWPSALHRVTGARPAAPVDADAVVALAVPAPPTITALRRGDALHPERGASLILAVGGLRTAVPPAPDRATTALTVSGPGVPGERRLWVDGVPAAVFAALAEANADFPAGVDTFLVAADGRVAGLPRSSAIDPKEG